MRVHAWDRHEDWLEARAAEGLSAGLIAPLAALRLGLPVSRAAIVAACWRRGIELTGRRRVKRGEGVGCRVSGAIEPAMETP